MRKLILARAAPLTVLQSVDSTNDFLRRMAAEGQKGAKTVLDIPPAYLSPKTAEELRASLW